MRITILTIALFSVLALPSCDSDDGPLSVQELEQIMEGARTCGAQDRCIVVDTYCCPRAINATFEASVKDANERLDADEGICLADCIGSSELTAACVQGLCTIVLPGS